MSKQQYHNLQSKLDQAVEETVCSETEKKLHTLRQGALNHIKDNTKTNDDSQTMSIWKLIGNTAIAASVAVFIAIGFFAQNDPQHSESLFSESDTPELIEELQLLEELPFYNWMLEQERYES
jgi:uncharacterized membrane protein YgaE (UPF0421/DUF939 family)